MKAGLLCSLTVYLLVLLNGIGIENVGGGKRWPLTDERRVPLPVVLERKRLRGSGVGDADREDRALTRIE